MSKTTILFLTALFPVCSLCGIAAMIRNGEMPTKTQCLGVILNSGLFGVGIAAAMFHYFGPDKEWLIFSVAVLSGLGGNALIVFFYACAKRIANSIIKTKWESDSAD